MAALSRHGHLGKNHVAELERPNINREEGSTLAFSQAQAKKLLDNPSPDNARRGSWTGRYFWWDCRWACGGRRLRHCKWQICIRTADTTHCASSAKVAGATRWLFILRPLRVYGHTWMPPATVPIWMGRYSGP
jgi:hypothetical protein